MSPHARVLVSALMVAFCASAIAGCARKERETRRDAGAARGTSETSVGAAGTAGSAGTLGTADTTREGHTFVATYEDGPVDRLRIVRDTSSGIVVEGATGFPDGTAIVISLLRPAQGRPETVAATRALVELGRFQGDPLLTANGPLPAGPVSVRLLVSFAPGRQSDAVLQATARGRRFRGAGMRVSPEGYAVYESIVEANL